MLGPISLYGPLLRQTETELYKESVDQNGYTFIKKMFIIIIVILSNILSNNQIIVNMRIVKKSVVF